MTREDLQQIEGTLQLSLPESYRDCMLNYPPALLSASFTIANDSDSYTERACEMEFVNSADALIALNRGMRPPDWPATYLVIGHNGCGDVYGIDTSATDPAVYIGGPHSGEYDDPEIAPSLQHFADWVIHSYEQRR